MGEGIKPQTEHARYFLSQIWAGADKGFISLVSKNKNGIFPAFGDITSVPELIDAFAERAGSADLYHCMGILDSRPEKGRSTENDMIAIPGLWIDLDCQEGTHNAAELPNREEALELIHDLHLRPSFTVWSGGGLHVYWLFKRPFYFVTPSERQAAKELSSRFQNFIICRGREKGWKIDNTSDLCRLLRLPGTFNHKKEPVRVEILEDSGHRYEKEDFDCLLSEVPSRPKPAGPASPDNNVNLDYCGYP